MNLSSTFFTATVDRGKLVWEQPAQVAVGLSKYKPGERIRVTLSRFTSPRTLDQNSRLWKLFQCFEEFGNTKKEAHDICCKLFLPPIVKELPGGIRVEIMRGTSNLTTTEMGSFMDEIESWLRDQNIYYGDHS